MRSTQCGGSQNNKSNARALLIDDHPLIIDAVSRALLDAQLFAGTVMLSSLAEAVSYLILDKDFALVIADLRMTDSDGIDSVTTLRESFPDLPLIVFSGNGSIETITAAFETGIRGYITKDSPLPVVINAIKLVMAGGCFLPQHAVPIIAIGLQPKITALDRYKKSRSDLTSLTPRQQQVFTLLLVGIPNKVIAERLNMAEGTVKAHLATVYRVLGVNSRAQAVLKAYELGLLH